MGPRAVSGSMTSLSDPSKLHDLKACRPIPHRKLLVMLNQFTVTTTRFLNRFANQCDDRLSRVSSDLSNLETTLAILEAKLSSVPGLEGAAAAADTSAIPDVAPDQPPAQSVGVGKPAAAPLQPAGQPPVAANPAPPAGPPAKDDPVYATYFKLIRLGMPLEQAKLKCQSEGNNPNVLDHPDDPVPAMLALPDAAGAGTVAPAEATVESTAIVPAGGAEPSTDIVASEESVAPSEDPNVMKLKDDPEYKKYFKMLAVGIPLPVVKHKMTMDGYDGGILDMDPNSPSPNA